MDEAEVEILLRVREMGREAFERVKAQLIEIDALEAALNDRQRTWNATANDGTPATGGLVNQLQSLAGAIPANVYAIAGMVAGVVALVGLLSPFIALIGAATVIVTAFGVAAAGAVTFLGLLGAGVAALGAGALFLGIQSMGGLGAAANLDKATTALQKAQQAEAMFNASHGGKKLTAAQQLQQQQILNNLATAQQNYNAALAQSQSPISQFIQDLQGVRDQLGQLAAPIAAQIIQWADKLLPTVEQVGASLLSWFGDRLPGVLDNMSRILKDLTPDFEAFANFLGNLYDQAAKINLDPLIEALIRFSLGAVEGLVRNLLRLTEWFQDRLPTYGPIVQQVFGAIGSAVQEAASLWGRFADWLASNWPAIVAAAKKEINDIRAAWEEWYPKLQPVIEQTLPQLITALKTIGEHAGGLVPIVLAVVTVILILVTTVATLESWLATLLDWLGKIEQRLRDLTNVNWAIDVGIVIPGLSQLERVYWLLTNMPGATGVFGHGGSGGGEGGGGGGASIAWITP